LFARKENRGFTPDQWQKILKKLSRFVRSRGVKMTLTGVCRGGIGETRWGVATK